jgi:hypothetical protein
MKYGNITDFKYASNTGYVSFIHITSDKLVIIFFIEPHGSGQYLFRKEIETVVGSSFAALLLSLDLMI